MGASFAQQGKNKNSNNRGKNNSGSNNSNANSNNIKCYNCCKQGHIAKNCPECNAAGNSTALVSTNVASTESTSQQVVSFLITM